ncbi:hypothetical protein F6X53_28935 [Methylobacterium soli]|uniref:Uncharacterized protein n=1 Tax=Methylobacterium soli TaxID=553447 RepID=A0A6L3SPP6_9HYPH|nr:hypothetical protein F6X53_28935 [Methylobacterium soli]
MMKFVLGAALAVALQLGTTNGSLAASGGGGGDGLDRGAAAQGNSTFAGQHRGPGPVVSRRRGGMGMMRHHRHRRHHR